jgi:hypothetical protein
MDGGKINERTDTVPLGNANLPKALGDRDLFNPLPVFSEDVHRLLGEHGFEVRWVGDLRFAAKAAFQGRIVTLEVVVGKVSRVMGMGDIVGVVQLWLWTILN